MVRNLCCMLLFLASAMILVACQPKQPYELQGQTMATSWSVKIVGKPSDYSWDTIKDDIHRLLESVDLSMSTYKEGSELSRFNRLPPAEWLPVSTSFFRVLRFAVDLCQETGGAFDPTVEPLVELWGFGAGPDVFEPPGEKAIQQARAKLGCEAVVFDEEKMRISKRDDIHLDLSAVAKGYAVDIVSNYLLLLGVDGYLVEVGGELFAGGLKADGTQWRVGVEIPDAQIRTAGQVLSLLNMGVATSGDYRNYFEHEGKRYSHTIDPRTGYPVTHNLASVTVLHPSVMQADGFATALDVMGVEEGLKFAELHELPVLFLVREDETIRPVYNDLMKAFLVN